MYLSVDLQVLMVIFDIDVLCIGSLSYIFSAPIIHKGLQLTVLCSGSKRARLKVDKNVQV